MPKRFKRLSLKEIALLGLIIGLLFLFNQFGLPYLQKNYPSVAQKIESVIGSNKTYRPERPEKSKDIKQKDKEQVAVTDEPKGHNPAFCNANTYEQRLPVVREELRDHTEMQLCYECFAVYYKHSFKTALWTAEKLTDKQIKAARGGEREKTFYQDPNVLAKYGDRETVKTTDYSGSGFDRGHLTPSGDLPEGRMRKETFYLSNIIPQTPQNNQNIWRQIELATRCLVDGKNDVYAITIPIFTEKQYLTTRRGLKIAIPTHIAKAVYAPNKNVAGVYLTVNDDSASNFSIISIDELVKRSGIEPFPTLKGDVRKKKNLPDPTKYNRTCY